MILEYKRNLEYAKSLIEIQNAYEQECKRIFEKFKKEYPDEYIHRMSLEHMSIWIIAEKCAIGKFGLSEEHWIRSRI